MSHLSCIFGQRTHWECTHRCLSSSLFKLGGPPSLSHLQPDDSSNTQGHRPRLCLEDINWNRLLREADGTSSFNTLGQARYFQKGCCFFFFFSPLFHVFSLTPLLYRGKNKCQTDHKEGHKPCLESSNGQMEKATSHLTVRACWYPRKIVAMNSAQCTP